MHFFLFYCVVSYCTAMMILQCIYTHCNSKSYDTVLIATGILYLSSLLKLSILFAHFLHASNVTVMIISSYLDPIMRKPGLTQTRWKTSEYSLTLESQI